MRPFDDATPTRAGDEAAPRLTVSADLLTKHERRLGPYLLKQPLGSGGTAQVYRAWKENPTQRPLPCVVKFPLHRYAGDEEGSRIFIHEARLSLMMGPHPNIVYVIDVGEYHRMPFIVMEYVDGIDLDMLVKRLRDRKKRLDLASIYCIVTAVAMGLHHAHFDAVDAGRPVCIVHRDVKPANILVTRRGFVKLADFGIGVTLDEGTSGTHMRGTARYMSPEHLYGVACPEMDVYSLGVVLWELIEGRSFREGLEKTQIFHAIMCGTIPPLRNRSCPSQLESLVYACLHPDRRQRPSAADVLLSLKHCPGYTTDVSFLAGELAALLGKTPSSGTTDPHFVATPDLVATMAALDFSVRAEAANSPKPVHPRREAPRPAVEAALDTDGREPDAPREPRPRPANGHLPIRAAANANAEAAGEQPPVWTTMPSSMMPRGEGEPPALAVPPRSELRPTGSVDTSATTKKMRKTRGSSSRAHTLLTLIVLWGLSLALVSAATAHVLEDLARAHPQPPTSGGPGEQARHP